jgi:hypothetical protein
MLTIRVTGFVAAATSLAIACTALSDLDGLAKAVAPAHPPADASASSSAASQDVDPADEIANGSGRDGDLEVSRDEIVNAYAALTASAFPGDDRISVEDASKLSEGRVVLVWQTTGWPAPTLGDRQPISLTGSTVGSYELARVVRVEGSSVVLDRPLRGGYSRPGVQVVSVPEYANVMVQPSGRLVPGPWDGERGGALALLVSGRLTNLGEISARGAGFRGGRPVPNAGLSDCVALAGTPATGYAARGEGVYPAGFLQEHDGGGPGGRGNLANGGGGGNCHNAGGGGGGNGGAGGSGGNSYSDKPVGGLGGAALVLSSGDRLLMGGGGGAGDAEVDPEATENALPGGAGGGVLFLRTAALDSAGFIDASGASPERTIGNGAPGGGAGGTVILAAPRAVCARAINAAGARGGDSSSGAGGGGGGGRVRLLPASAGCGASVEGGHSGETDDIGPRGATGGEPGTADR